MKSRFAVLFGFILSLSLQITVFGGDDLSKGEILRILMQTAPDYTSYISEEDIVSGYNDGDFRDEKLADDVEMLVMLSRAFPSMESPKGNNYITLPQKAVFGELPEWAQKHFEYLNSRGILSSELELDDSVTMDELNMYLKRIWRYYGGDIKDDFYMSANREFFFGADTEVDMYNNAFSDAAHNCTRRVGEIIKETVEKDEPTEKEQKIKNLYLSALKMQSDGGDISPLKPYFDIIDGVITPGKLSDAMIKCNKGLYLSGLMNFDITVDAMDPDRYLPVLSITQPPFEYEQYQNDKYRDVYIDYISGLLEMAGESSEAAAKDASVVYETGKKVSPHCLKSYEAQTLEKTYNLMTLAELGEWFDYIDLKALAKSDGLELDDNDVVLVRDPGLTYNMAMVWKTELGAAKAQAKINLLIEYGKTLSPECIEAGDKYAAAVSGLPYTPLTAKDRAVSITKEHMADYLSEIYCEKYITNEDKAYAEEMVGKLKDVYREKINGCDWLSKSTKVKAIGKLNAMTVKVGYEPDKNDFIKNADIGADSLFDNVLEIMKEYTKYKGIAYNKPVDRSVWQTAAYEANAFYMPTRNEIVLPAGILQAPFYSPEADIEENMAGIGMITAHEMCHAFDSSGANFDKKGAYKNWWTEEDRKNFAKKCSDIAVFYDGEECVTDIKTNGRITLGENIADLGAAVCASEALEKYKNADMKKFYLTYARTWAEISSRDFMIYANMMDEHPRANVRVNLCLANCDKFVETFDIKEGDGMYIPKEKRVGLW